MPVKGSRIAFVCSALIAASSIGYNVFAHGNVTPQAVDTSKLPDIKPDNTTWVTKNPYRDDPQVYAMAKKIGLGRKPGARKGDGAAAAKRGRKPADAVEA